MSGDDLFSMASERQKASFEPLAVRMRPQVLDEIYGQEQIVGSGTFLRAMIERDTIPSLLLYGPSGVGKTTLAHVIACETNSRFVRLNAVTAGTAELRKVIQEAKDAVHLYQRVEAVDTCVGRVVEAIKKMGGVALITADHGNADKLEL